MYTFVKLQHIDATYSIIFTYIPETCITVNIDKTKLKNLIHVQGPLYFIMQTKSSRIFLDILSFIQLLYKLFLTSFTTFRIYI